MRQVGPSAAGRECISTSVGLKDEAHRKPNRTPNRSKAQSPKPSTSEL